MLRQVFDDADPDSVWEGNSRVAIGSRSWQRLSCYALRLALSLPYSRIASSFTLGDVYTGSMYAVRRSATSCDGREVMTAFLACCNAFPGLGGRFGYDEHLTVTFPILWKGELAGCDGNKVIVTAFPWHSPSRFVHTYSRIGSSFPLGGAHTRSM